MTTPAFSTTQPNVSSSPLRPGRWLLVGSDAWRQAWSTTLQQHLTAGASALLRWRIDFELVRAVAPEDLDAALSEALLEAPTVLRVIAEPVLKVEATRTLSRALNHAPDVKGYIGASEAPFENLLMSLDEPDGLALARWLCGPRHRQPVHVYRQDGSSEFHQRADEALAEWLDGFLDRAGDGMLDELYGPADDGRPEQPDATTTAPAGLSQPAWLAPGSAGAGASTGRLHARGVLHAAAAASGRTLPLTLPRDGRIDGDLGASAGSGDSGDRYTLQWPMEAGTDRPQFLPEATVEVTLDLEAAAWAHRHPRTLVLQPASQWLPLLVNWTEPGAAPPSGRWMLTAKLKMTRQAFIECQTATTLVELVVEQEGVPAA